MTRPFLLCLFCGGDAGHPEHLLYCDGRQGAVEAQEAAVQLEPDASADASVDDDAPDDAQRGAAYWSRKAEAFHEANPHVLAKLHDIARDLKRRGVQHSGIQLLFERLRWINVVETAGDKYRLSNSFAAWYARRLMADDPDLAGFFVTRESAHDPDFHQRPVRGEG